VDLLVDDQIVIECKSKGTINTNDFKQLRSYLQLGEKQTGLLINF
jgi:GxxExxY protein